jgi:glycosyltransferase involved in cell wall biosynthesis
VTEVVDGSRGRVGLFVSTDLFEHFYGDALGLTVEQYLATYRNEWSWDYMSLLRGAGVEPTLYVASRVHDGLHLTADGFRVRFLRAGLLYRLFERLPTMRRSALWRWVAGAVNGLSVTRGLRRAGQVDRLDLLLLQEYWTGRLDVLAHTLRVPLVAMDHGMPERGELRVFKARALARLLSATVQTEAELRKVRAYGQNVVKLPNGVDTSFFAPGDPQAREQVVVSVGRLLEAQKCQGDLVAALALLPEPWRLALYGRGPDEDHLRREVERLGVGDRVVFHGFADRARLREVYRTAGVVALPSAYEGLPLVLLEAMACGAAVVGTDIPPIAEVLEDGTSGIVIPVHRPDLLASAITTAWDQRERLGTAAALRVRRTFSREQLRDGLLDLLAQARG